jgi:dolichyl-diphosphooligosaccharide--protein glycosyltransferase
MVKFRKLFGREKLVKALKSFGALRFRVSHSSLVVASLLFLILLLAFLIRILPMRWGTYLSEFDPYFQYRLTNHMVENGFTSWAYWHDSTGWPMSWYPYGRDITGKSYPGLPFTAASLYLVLNGLGLPITLLELCVIFPVIMAILTCLVMYFLGKDFGGKMVGLFSALFLALNASYIGRTSWGFFDDETVGIFALLLFMFFFLRSIETQRSLRGGLIYALAAGLSLGYLFASWGAARYPMGMAVVFVFALLLLRRYSSRLLFSYSTTFGVAVFIAVNVPRLSLEFLTTTEVFAVFGIFVLLCAYEIVQYIRTTKMKTAFVFGFFAFSAFSFLMLSWLGYVGPITQKYLFVLNPATRPAFVQSVQEHRPAAWGSFYYDIGIGAFFMPVGLFFAARNPTNRNIFLIIFGLTTIYFASSMIRLTLLLAPAVSILWALALVQLLRPFITIMKEIPAIPRRKMRFATHVGKEFSGAVLIVVFLLLLFTFVLPNPRVFSQADTPTTIAAASAPFKPQDTVYDWIDTLAWMRENLPPNAVVASWWDYGYWITIWGNKTSLADNGTINSTQIGKIGYMFMSNETEAIKVLEKFNQVARARGFNHNVSHVLVFTTFYTDGQDAMFGDEGKWRWMARIAAQRGNPVNETDFGEYNNETGAWEWNDLGKSTVIYKLMTYGKSQRVPSVPAPTLEHFELAYFSKGAPIHGQVYVLVCVYEVKYV